MYNLGEFGKNLAEEDNELKKQNSNNLKKEKELEKNTSYLEEKIISKTKQYEALINLLQHVNELQSKDTKIESDKLLNKIKQIENDINRYKQLLM
jgi:hypothetical protein